MCLEIEERPFKSASEASFLALRYYGACPHMTSGSLAPIHYRSRSIATTNAGVQNEKAVFKRCVGRKVKETQVLRNRNKF